MKLKRLLKDTVDIKRMQEDAYGESMAVVYSDVNVLIDQDPPNTTNQDDGYTYDRYRMYCESDVDVDTGDKIVDGSDEYKVRGVTKRRVGNRESVKHKVAIIIKDDANT